jgi:hypothetical protein
MGGWGGWVDGWGGGRGAHRSTMGGMTLPRGLSKASRHTLQQHAQRGELDPTKHAAATLYVKGGRSVQDIPPFT